MLRKVLKILLITVGVAILLAGILWAFNGSLEMFPTEEQIGKAEIGAAFLIILGAMIGGAGLLIKSDRHRGSDRNRSSDSFRKSDSHSA